MTHIFYEIPFNDDEGHMFAALEGEIFFSTSLEDGEPFVQIDRFETAAFDGYPIDFSALSADYVMRALFFRAKVALESNENFLSAAFEKDGTISFVGKGANDPDAFYRINE